MHLTKIETKLELLGREHFMSAGVYAAPRKSFEVTSGPFLDAFSTNSKNIFVRMVSSNSKLPSFLLESILIAAVMVFTITVSLSSDLLVKSDLLLMNVRELVPRGSKVFCAFALLYFINRVLPTMLVLGRMVYEVVLREVPSKQLTKESLTISLRFFPSSAVTF